MSIPVLLIPGIGNSGPDHWQTLWETADASMVRIKVKDWDHPICSLWVEAIDAKALSIGKPPIIVAHSLGCLAFAHWAAKRRRNVRGALLVAIPDPRGPKFPPQAEGFSPFPLFKLPYQSIVVSSSDDPYASPDYVKSCADAWGSALVNIGCAGHVNSASNLGDWPDGLSLLNVLRS